MDKVIQLLTVCCIERQMTVIDMEHVFLRLDTDITAQDCIGQLLSQDLIQVSFDNQSGYELTSKGTRVLGHAIKDQFR